MKLLNISVAVSFCFVLLSGCSIMSKEECLSADWHNVGYNDALSGKSSSLVSEYLEACSEYTRVDVNQYNEGRKQGAEIFCTDDNGFEQGVNNASLTDICNISSNYQGFIDFYRRGQEVYKAASYVYLIDDQIQRIDEYSSDNRFGPLLATLSANRAYLQSIRSDVYNYYQYVYKNAKSGGVVAKDYSYAISNVPYPRALESAEEAKYMINDVDDALFRINNRVRENEDCMRTADDAQQRDNCRRKIDCYRNEEHRLLDNSRRAMHSLADGYSLGNTGWIRDYSRCDR